MRGRRGGVGPIYGFLLTWLFLSLFSDLYLLQGLLFVLAASLAVAFIIGRASGRNAEKKAAKEAAAKKKKQEEQKKKEVEPKKIGENAKPQKKSYGPEIDPIIAEGNRALSEMGRLYQSIKDPEIRVKINEIMRITDKITQDAIADPSDIPQIKKFMNYYLPTTIKLLNSYDRMSSQGVPGENLDKSMKSINEMLDTAIVAYQKRLDSLFANQALDIETDIEVMNAMLSREGLTEKKDFHVQTQTSSSSGSASSAAVAAESK